LCRCVRIPKPDAQVSGLLQIPQNSDNSYRAAYTVRGTSNLTSGAVFSL